MKAIHKREESSSDQGWNMGLYLPFPLKILQLLLSPSENLAIFPPPETKLAIFPSHFSLLLFIFGLSPFFLTSNSSLSEQALN